jgi:hypothetical protein
MTRDARIGEAKTHLLQYDNSGVTVGSVSTSGSGPQLVKGAARVRADDDSRWGSARLD